MGQLSQNNPIFDVVIVMAWGAPKNRDIRKAWMFASLILWVEEDVVRKCGHCKLEQDICHYSIFSYCMLEMFVIIVSFSFQLLIIYRHYIGYRCLYKSLSYYIIHVSFLDVLQFLFGFNTFPWTGSKAHRTRQPPTGLSYKIQRVVGRIHGQESLVVSRAGGEAIRPLEPLSGW